MSKHGYLRNSCLVVSVDKSNYFEIDNTIECHKYLDFAGAQHTAGTIPLFSV